MSLSSHTNRFFRPSNHDQEWHKTARLVAGALLLGILGGLAVVILPNPLAGFGLVAGLVVGFFMLGKPLFTLQVAIIISLVLPFAVIPVKLGLTLTFLEATLLILFGVWLVKVAMRSDEAGQKLVSSPIDWSILLLVGICIFAFILGLGWVNSTEVFHNFFKFILAILSFFAVINIVRTQQALDSVLKVILLAGSAAGYIGVGLYALSRSLQERILLLLRPLGYPDNRLLRYVEDDPAKGQRATGLSVDPNSYGGLLVLVIAVLLCQLVSSRPVFRKWVIVLMLIGPTLALVLTYGRGATYLGAPVVIAFIATVKYRKIWLYALPAGVAGWFIMPSNIKKRITDGIAFQDQASQMRLDEYRNALQIIERYPWFGVGFGSAPSVDLTTGASMTYLTIAQQTGLVGLAAYLLVMVLFFAYFIRSIGKLKDERQQANLLGFAGGILGALAVGLLDHYFFNIEYSHLAALFWLYMGLAVVQIKIGESR